MSPPPTMRAWQYSSTHGGLEKNLRLNASAPTPTPSSNQHLVQPIACALNPIDYKPTENPIIGRLAVKKPATPGIDFAGYLVTPAAGSVLKPGQLVFGAAGLSPLAGGGLAEYALAKDNQIVAVPEGVDPIAASSITVVGLTAYQTIAPYVKAGDKVFINGGSGGTGVLGIQIAKTIGAHVTTTCSTPNVELCKSLGADKVIDYRKENVVAALKATGWSYDHVIDNVGHDYELYWKCDQYTKPGARYMAVAATLSLSYVWETLMRKIWPGFLGGPRRKSLGFFPEPKPEDLETIVAWVKDGKIKPVIDQKFPFEQAPEAIAKLKTQRAKGKIIVEITSDGFQGR